MYRLKNPIFLLASASLISCLVLGISLGGKLKEYFELSTPAKAQVLSWEIRKKSANLYYLGAHFRYQTTKGVFESFSLWKKSPYPNAESAKNYLSHLKTTPCMCYYSRSNPEYVTLERFFPYNSLFRWLIAAILTFYFPLFWTNKLKKTLDF